MSMISNLFEGLTSDTKVLPSAKERKGIRLSPPEGVLDTAINNLESYYQEYPYTITNLMSNEGQKDFNNLRSKPLNLFALSGSEALADYLDSDAVTGAGVEELGDLAAQLELSYPNATGRLESLHSLPYALSNLNASSVVDGASAVPKLARLFSMLKIRPNS